MKNIAKILSRVRTNWKPGVTVALVSIPLSLSLAIASGANPVQGIITAIWAGLLAALFGGSSYNIVGPAGALTGILAAFSLKNGFELLPSVAVVSGVFVLLAYLLKLERYLVFVPSSAIHGFTLGVAILIAFGQLNSALGLPKLISHETFLENLVETIENIHLASGSSIAIFALFLAFLFLLAKYLKKVPTVLVVAFVGMVFGYLSKSGLLGLDAVILGDKYPDFRGTVFVYHGFKINYSIIVTSLTVAVVAIIETLLSARIADGMTKTRFNRRKEMLGLGLANVASGIFGGLPATGVLVRTSLNIKSGATSKASALVNSVAVGIFSMLLLTYFKFIPMPVIAAILVYVAIRMVGYEHFAKFWQVDKLGFFLAMVVAFVTVFEDPMVAILIGTAVTLLILVEKISKGQFELAVNKKNKGIIHTEHGEGQPRYVKAGDTLVYSIKGQLLYLNGQAHLIRFDQGLNGYKNVVLRLRELHFLDMDGVDTISEIILTIRSQGRNVAITGVNNFIRDFLKESVEFKSLDKDGLVFSKTTDALKYFGHKIK